jgi:salicylate hydroxylase
MTADLALKPLRVAIVGGGPGGLGTAIALSRVPNMDVKIYEQASALREVGAGISIGSNSWKVLDLLGVSDALNSGHPTWTTLNLYVSVLSTKSIRPTDAYEQEWSIW